METDQEKNRGRFIEQQRKKRHAGKAYLNRNKTRIDPKNPPNQQSIISLLVATALCFDRDFALIEKRKRVMKAIIPNDLHKVITSAKYDPPFEVVDMSVNGFWDIKEAADKFLNTKNLNISKAVRIKVDCKNPTVLLIKESFSDVEAWKQVNILKQGKTIGDLKSAKIALLLPENKELLLPLVRICTKGMRNSLPNARIMIHQPSGGVTGQATDIKIQAEEILKLKKQINCLYEKHTGMPLERVENSLERDNFMSPKEAMDFGIIDQVLISPPKKSQYSEPINTSSKNESITVKQDAKINEISAQRAHPMT
ncbi:hypothetical protein NQ314_020879 [Rhamnusium bicolor]|uniref:ATP-dependent Clp protease proteolytic subunit n=1 Tax=Rhamnusium bicolor TaxID=1586634 RepID=A0AAV8WJY6_9CUCU|nr:hypothetical protein NQ314_020879 [Rhamnusium bicolor]